MKLLVTGGAGYIGSVVAAQLIEDGHEVVVLDDLSTGYAAGVPRGAAFVEGDLRTGAAAVLATGIDAVLHFAAKSLVAESVARPGRYWQHNLGGTLALLEAMREARVGRIVFSSTAAVYGEPESVPIEETAPTRPTNPYGASKLAVDTALAEYARMHGFAAVSLRYFNVAGAYRERGGGWLGERHDPETHLIPTILSVALSGAGEVAMFGDDYPTPDGTCVRDYIHVADLAKAHLLALPACTPGEHKIFNVGSGSGFSNREVLEACRDVTGRLIPARMAGRRPGDPAALIASSDRIRAGLHWRAARSLTDMVADSWAFAESRAGAR
ncbi:MAG TPA: UDP-glucose 4-epimerase GalE [Streptosporangiaceae bacterium]|jgi:UDP-glucose 4-epimerase|nr:UDP-glucose 4-epimerase GalE [Streptosporangiaceae bacterium]